MDNSWLSTHMSVLRREIMKRIVWFILISAVPGWTAIVEAQQQAKTFKIGWLESGTTDRGSGSATFSCADSLNSDLSMARTSLSSIVPLIINWTGFPPWRMSSYVSTSMCCLQPQHRQRLQPKMRPRRSPLFSCS